MDYIEKIYQRFKNTFGQEPLMVCSPGRVNLIGEHTDYNHGFVLPAAIDKYIYLAIQKRDDEEIHLLANDLDDQYSTSLSTLEASGKLWPDYLLGVAQQFLKEQHQLRGFNAVFGGDIPQGAGMSSSAALECATAFGLNHLFSLDQTRLQMALLAQAAENEFVGVQCGLMDQFASLFGKAQHLIQLDCDNYNYKYVPFPDENIQILLLDTRVKHSLASSAYNQRREQCETGVAMVSRHHQQVNSLRDANEEMLLQHVKPFDELIYRRCSFVVAENDRLIKGCEDLEKGDFAAFGKKMYQTHLGLSKDYEVSCAELDLLVELASAEPAIFGARMMGGGFGGCTINLIKADQTAEIISRMSAAYQDAFGKAPKAYVAKIGQGTHIVDLKKK